MKRLVLCFDGSWNRLDAPHPTNVLLTAESVMPMADKSVGQITFYDEGVGSEDGDAFVGGVFGAGLVKNLSDGYRFLIFNYSPGDEIFVFGFSRGAYTARSFIGLLSTCGILHRQHARRANEAVDLYKRRRISELFQEEVLRFRSECSPHICVSDREDAWRTNHVAQYRKGSSPLLKVKYLGVWDTVGALGIPRYFVLANAINRIHQFHDVSLSPIVEQARHAVAIDEQKVDFEPTLWENLRELNLDRHANPESADAPYQQMWFPGRHGSVGGGGERRGLSDLALEWIWDGARQAGLDLDASPQSHLARLRSSHRENLINRDKQAGFNPVGFVLDRLPTAARQPGPQRLHEVSPMARRRWKERPINLPEAQAYRPATLRPLESELDAQPDDIVGVPEQGDEGFLIYIVKPNDTLERISDQIYGTPAKAEAIFQANLNKLSGPGDLHSGQSLRLPAI
ncbi:phospholipase effector Tle1 domain-containing protein [Devosia psychrophila]|uniref:Uncharacterized protein, PA2063/DUF2235 family n=1 Tax=Devosia psychrophila TaxID=728005 RepID=A0A0F5PTF5_9HYPH|nr:DUF2235 domain-containing protein [Devosia psychrophila]KKC31895.1 hypothetical protein WH91_17010 [Devosia psychrophila]SFD42124.1 Uncharacterized protein, PA2063/DUF2235 family [Devosia psychrophila]